MFENETRVNRIASELGLPTVNMAICGSTLICGSGKDLDVLCLMANTKDDDAKLLSAGFRENICDEYIYKSLFRSWRRDDVNLLVTQDHSYFMAEIAAAWGAHVIAHNGSIDMTKREDRVLFHGLVRNAVSHHLGASVSKAIPTDIAEDNETHRSSWLTIFKRARDATEGPDQRWVDHEWNALVRYLDAVRDMQPR